MTATKVFDCASPLTAETAAAFAADGYEIVARYLVPYGWKRLTADEANVISDAGLSIISVFETAADRALGGYDAGYADGLTALECARNVGQPEGSAIYFAVDFGATADQMAAVIDYIRGASDATPGYWTGTYGCYDVIEAVKAAGAGSRYWLTYAWSGGRKSDDIHVYQYRNDIEMNGIGVDLDEAYGNEGAWNLRMTNVILMSADDADKIIAFMAAGYGATDSDEAKAEFHRLANELRKVSGQPEE